MDAGKDTMEPIMKVTGKTKREGFGFSIAPKKPLRIGEWKNDRYKGERLVYTSERIYGIDLSKYQHGKGRKNMLSTGTVYALHILDVSAKRPYQEQ